VEVVFAFVDGAVARHHDPGFEVSRILELLGKHANERSNRRRLGKGRDFAGNKEDTSGLSHANEADW
jgi:hypothetical protein